MTLKLKFHYSAQPGEYFLKFGLPVNSLKFKFEYILLVLNLRMIINLTLWCSQVLCTADLRETLFWFSLKCRRRCIQPGKSTQWLVIILELLSANFFMIFSNDFSHKFDWVCFFRRRWIIANCNKSAIINWNNQKILKVYFPIHINDQLDWCDESIMTSNQAESYQNT